MKLTQSAIGNLQPKTATYDVHDTQLRRLVIRVRPTGVKTFLVRLRDRTKQHAVTGRTVWYWEVLGPADGKARRPRRGQAEGHVQLTLERARELARKQIGLEASGQDPRETRREGRARARRSITLGDFIKTDYEPWVTAHRKTGAETVERLNSRFASLLATRLDELTAFAVERWRTGRTKDGAKASTVNRDLAALKAALARAVEWKRLSLNPLKAVKPSKVDSVGVIRFLSTEEEGRLLRALDDRDDRRRRARESANTFREERGYDQFPAFGDYTDVLTPLVHVALHTGLRFGELCNLTWTDVDLTAPALLTVRGDGAKSGQTRQIPLNDHARDVLKKWRPANPDRADRVFPDRDGERLGEIKTAWKRITKEAKVDAFRFHDLRHTFASKLVQVGIDLNTVRELLGHGDIKMTLRYAHLAPEQKRAAVAKLVVA